MLLKHFCPIFCNAEKFENLVLCPDARMDHRQNLAHSVMGHVLLSLKISAKSTLCNPTNKRIDK